jgi:ligand-binding SRPBCC domain-containing protein
VDVGIDQSQPTILNIPEEALTMKRFSLHTKQILPITLEEAWAFFSSPMNLSKITPAYMNFKILSGFEEGTTREGMIIKYKVHPIMGIPLTWVTKITNVSAPHEFTDMQMQGPYKEWVHTHRFREVEGGVEMTDELYYQLPMGPLGVLMHSLFIRKQVEGIFAYRTKTLETLFPAS